MQTTQLQSTKTFFNSSPLQIIGVVVGGKCSKFDWKQENSQFSVTN